MAPAAVGTALLLEAVVSGESCTGRAKTSNLYRESVSAHAREMERVRRAVGVARSSSGRMTLSWGSSWGKSVQVAASPLHCAHREGSERAGGRRVGVMGVIFVGVCGRMLGEWACLRAGVDLYAQSVVFGPHPRAPLHKHLGNVVGAVQQYDEFHREGWIGLGGPACEPIAVDRLGGWRGLQEICELTIVCPLQATLRKQCGH